MKTPLLTPVLRHGLLLLILAGTLCGLAARAQTPQFMTYQGYLTDQNGAPLATNGPANYAVVFRLWSQPTGGATPLYGELQVVTVANGYFSVLLGQGTPYTSGGNTDPQPPLSAVFSSNNGPSRYVEMTVKGLANGADVTILPRLQLVSAPYAFMAANANALVSATSGSNVITSSGNNVSVSGAVTATGFTGNGSGLTSLNAAALTGQVPAAALPGVALLASANVFTAAQTINTTASSGGQAGLKLISGSGSTSRASRLDFLNAPASTTVPQWTLINDYDQQGFNDLRFVNDTQNSQLTLLQNGDVGIGTPKPNALLQIQTSVQHSNPLLLSGTEYYQGNFDNNGISLLLGVNRPGNRQLWVADSAAVPGASSNNAVIRIMPGASTIDSIAMDGVTTMPLHLGNYSAVTITPSGYVGIGTTSPSRAALEVDSYVLQSFAGILSIPTSIYASEYVYGAAFESTSDERVKNIKGKSDGAADLKTLLGIKITDYTYKDTMANGNRPHKKVIAQQVEQVYPQAVSQSTDVVPDIYTNATVKDGWVQLATDLKVGDRVKLISGKEKGVHEVVDVREGAFRTNFKPATDKVFVYGREVKDLRAVDYDAISMLNVSATQELARRLDQVEARETRLADLEQKAAQVAALERQVSDLRKMVLELAGSKSSKLAEETPEPGNLGAGAGQRATLTTASLAN